MVTSRGSYVKAGTYRRCAVTAGARRKLERRGYHCLGSSLAAIEVSIAQV
jgi:hypothetical protein